MEGKHWVKGKLIGTGAFCSCFLARDTRLGTMMAVKQVCPVIQNQTNQFTISSPPSQVSYVRNNQDR